MIDLEFVEGLIRAVDESGLDSVEIERGGTRIRVSKSPSGTGVVTTQAPQASPAPASAPVTAPAGAGGGGAQAASGQAPPAGAEAPEVASPMVGTFYRAPSPDSDPYVKVGDSVSEGDTLCIIEAMKLMNELECEVSGEIAEILVEDAEPVEYGQALFKIRPAG